MEFEVCKHTNIRKCNKGYLCMECSILGDVFVDLDILNEFEVVNRVFIPRVFPRKDT